MGGPNLNPFAELCATLELQIGSVDALTQAVRASRMPPAQPGIVRIPVAGVAPASGILILTFPECPQGYRWNCRGIAVGGLSPLTTAAGRVDVYVTRDNLAQLQGNANELQIGMKDWVDFSTTLPNAAFYSADENPVQEGEALVLVLSGVTATQTYVGNALFQMIQLAAVPQVTAI